MVPRRLTSLDSQQEDIPAPDLHVLFLAAASPVGPWASPLEGTFKSPHICTLQLVPRRQDFRVERTLLQYKPLFCRWENWGLEEKKKSLESKLKTRSPHFLLDTVISHLLKLRDPRMTWGPKGLPEASVLAHESQGSSGSHNFVVTSFKCSSVSEHTAAQ